MSKATRRNAVAPRAGERGRAHVRPRVAVRRPVVRPGVRRPVRRQLPLRARRQPLGGIGARFQRLEPADVGRRDHRRQAHGVDVVRAALPVGRTRRVVGACRAELRRSARRSSRLGSPCRAGFSSRSPTGSGRPRFWVGRWSATAGCSTATTAAARPRRASETASRGRGRLFGRVSLVPTRAGTAAAPRINARPGPPRRLRARLTRQLRCIRERASCVDTVAMGPRDDLRAIQGRDPNTCPKEVYDAARPKGERPVQIRGQSARSTLSDFSARSRDLVRRPPSGTRRGSPRGSRRRRPSRRGPGVSPGHRRARGTLATRPRRRMRLTPHDRVPVRPLADG